MDEPTSKPEAHKPDKAQRLTEALRENLRKRKTQSRARRGGAGGGAQRTDNDPAPDATRTDTESGDQR